jgi:hypothetical protein
MKKFVLLFLGVFLFYSCLNNDNNIPNFAYELLPVDEAVTPESFTFGEIDTIAITYTLPNSCYSLDRLFYETQDTTRIVAVIAYVDLENTCTQATITEEYKFEVTAAQREDYVFKFFKGTDSNGENIFEEIVVPVN